MKKRDKKWAETKMNYTFTFDNSLKSFVSIFLTTLEGIKMAKPKSFDFTYSIEDGYGEIKCDSKAILLRLLKGWERAIALTIRVKKSGFTLWIHNGKLAVG